MPLSLVPKYDIGDVVYFGNAAWTHREITCPDCLGLRQWDVTTPAGQTFKADCGTCKNGWFPTGKIFEYGDFPSVRCVTIGSIRIDTADEDRPIEYMCLETGVGSGAVYAESMLFKTEAEAMEYATRMSAELTEARNLQEKKTRLRNKSETIRKPRSAKK